MTQPFMGPAGPRRPVLRIERRHVPAVMLVVVAVAGFSGGLERLATVGPFGDVQRTVTSYLDRSETKAVEAFAVARAINASVSVLKSADISAVFAQVAPMEVLEPVDDLAKQFSDVMVVSIVSIMVQRLILGMAEAWGLGVVLPIGCVLLVAAAAAYRSPGTCRLLTATGRNLVLLALFARFVVPAAGLAGTVVTQRFLAADLDTSLAVMHDSGGNLTKFTTAVAPDQPQSAGSAVPPAQDNGATQTQTLLDRFHSAMRTTAATSQAIIDKGSALMNSARSWVPDKAGIEALVIGLPGHIVKAIEIFLVETILIPLGIALLFYSMLRGIIPPKTR
jgi:hypothetical protein